MTISILDWSGIQKPVRPNRVIDTLVVGDLIEIRHRNHHKGWWTAIVVASYLIGDRVVRVEVRRTGFDKRGRKYPVIERREGQVRRIGEDIYGKNREGTDSKNTAPNIYADWLEENDRGDGHYIEAANALRRVFPLGEPE